MTEEQEDVKKEEATSTESSTEEKQPEAEAIEEQIDDAGVPIKNRLAEANRKLEKARQLEEAQKALANQQKSEVTEDEAIKIVKNLAQEEAKKLVEPILVKQFLHDNPDAVELIDDINKFRAKHPELGSVENLDIAYKVVKSEKQDEIIRQRLENEKKELTIKKEKSEQAAIEGTGKNSAPTSTLEEKIANAKTEEELNAIMSGAGM